MTALQALSATKLQIAVTKIQEQWEVRARRTDWSDGTITRAEVLRLSAENALDFNLEVEKRGDVVFVDLSSLSTHPKNPLSPLCGNVDILSIDSSFLQDLKRLKLQIKDGRIYAKTFRQVARNGEWKAHICPLISVVASKKYGANWDVVFLSARTISGDILDLRKSNVYIPCLERTVNTVRQNAKFDKDVLKSGHEDWLADPDTTPARIRKPKGYGADSDDGDVAGLTASKMHVPASDGQITENTNIVDDVEFDPAPAEPETEPETSTNADLFLAESGQDSSESP